MSTTENIRKLPGDLEFLTPSCPICAEYTDAMDGGFSCHGCGIAWDKDGENAERIDPAAEQCPSLYRPTYRCTHPGHANEEYRCWRDAGHDGKHYNPDSFYGWDDDEQTAASAEAVTS